MDGILTVGGAISILTTIVAFLAILAHFRKRAREDRADAQEREDRLLAEIGKHNDSVEKRLTTLEIKSADFMPRAEIEAKIEHEKNNRLAGNQAVQRTLERHDEAINALRVEVGGIAVQISNSHTAVQRVETQLEKLCEKVDKLVARA